MGNKNISVRLLSIFIYGWIAAVLSCSDHEDPELPNDPASACRKLNGDPRPYPCEFRIEKLTFYAKDNTVVGEVSAGAPNIFLSRSKAKQDSNPSANTEGAVGTLTYDVKATVTRLANASFPVSAGYQLVYTPHVSGLGALTTPGESFITGSPVMLPIPVGGTTEVSFELPFLYRLSSIAGEIRPVVHRGLTAFLIYNDVTSAHLDLHPSYIGDVAESYVRINMGVGE